MRWDRVEENQNQLNDHEQTRWVWRGRGRKGQVGCISNDLTTLCCAGMRKRTGTLLWCCKRKVHAPFNCSVRFGICVHEKAHKLCPSPNSFVTTPFCLTWRTWRIMHGSFTLEKDMVYCAWFFHPWEGHDILCMVLLPLRRTWYIGHSFFTLEKDMVYCAWFFHPWEGHGILCMVPSPLRRTWHIMHGSFTLEKDMAYYAWFFHPWEGHGILCMVLSPLRRTWHIMHGSFTLEALVLV